MLPVLLTLGLVAGALALPSLEPRAEPIQVAHLTFHGGPASYELAVPADGTVITTPSNIAINIIDANDYNALTQCRFTTDGPKTIVQSIDTTNGNQHLIIGPPQPIRSVSCLGKCVATYSDCYSNGQYVGPCCNGFCAANKCRPWTTGSS